MLARGDAKTALVYFDMAEAIAPQSKRVQTNIELAQAMLDDTKLGKDEHLDSKTRARKLNNYGYVAMLRGDREDAERYFLAAIDTHPSFYAVAHKNLQTLRTSKPRTQ